MLALSLVRISLIYSPQKSFFSLISFSEASKGTFHTTIFELFCFAKEAGLRCDALLL